MSVTIKTDGTVSGTTITADIPQPPAPPVIPGKPWGYQTFYQAAPDQNKNVFSPKQAYFRYRWGDIESSPGAFNLAQIDRDYAAAKAAGQKFNFRIMAWDDENPGGPVGLRSLGGFDLFYNHVSCWQPNLDLATVRDDLTALIAALGARYAANTATVDIGFFGAYGEWSSYGQSPTLPLPSLSTWDWLIKQHKKYFPGSIIVTQACVSYEYQNNAYLNTALADGCWQRFDSWGKSDEWDEQADAAALAQIQASPYFGKICTIGEPWDVSTWTLDDYRSAVAFAKSARMAMFSTKGVQVPTSAIPVIQDLLAYEASL